jgi:hypothetical protein
MTQTATLEYYTSIDAGRQLVMTKQAAINQVRDRYGADPDWDWIAPFLANQHLQRLPTADWTCVVRLLDQTRRRIARTERLALAIEPGENG